MPDCRQLSSERKASQCVGLYATLLARVASICFLSSVSAARLFALDPHQPLDQLYHTSWTAKEGLPGAVQKITQTADGYLWIGTSDGLFRFDGLVFERYHPDVGVLHASSVSALLPVPDGGLWVGYTRGGASFVKNGRVINYTEREGLPINTLRSFAQDHDGTVWAATVGGVARLDGGRWRTVRTDWRYPCLSAWSLFVDHRGTLWVGGASPSQIVFLPKGARAFQEAGIHAAVFGFAEATDGTLWFGHDDRATVEVLPVASRSRGAWPVLELPARALMVDRQGALWIAGARVHRVPFPDRLRGQRSTSVQHAIETFSQEQGLTGSLVHDVFEDREGNIWVGTENGLDRLRHRNVSSSRLRKDSAQISLVAGERGDVWAVSSDPPYLMRVQDAKPVPGAPADISMAYRDPDGTIWFSAKESFWRWKHGAFSQVRPPAEVEARRVPFKVLSATADRSGRLWLSINGLGQFRLHNDTWTFSVVLQERPDLTAIAALTDSADRVWLAFLDTIAVLEHGAIRRFSIADGLDVGPLLAMADDGRRIWAGGESGLAFLDGNRFRTIRLAAARSLGLVTGIVAPPRDGVWLSASAGIVHIPESEVQRALRDPEHRVDCEVLDLVSDLPESLQRRQNAISFASAVQGSDGLLWFVTARDVVRVDPKHIVRNPLAPPVVIRAILAGDRSYPLHDGLALPPLTRNLRIDYAALSLSIPERVRFRYRLDGWDTDWHDAGAERSAFYTQLAPGGYTFRVIACNNDGVWNHAGAAVAFTVAPAWFQTAGFRAVLVVWITALLWALYRLRMRQMATALSVRFDERLAERTRIARDLHDTLLQTVQGSRLVADAALEQADDAPRVRHSLEQLSRWLAQATQEGRAALNSLRTSSADMVDLGDVLRRTIKNGVKPASMTIAFVATGDPKELHPILGDEIARIGYEAIHNARVHSMASRVEVELAYSHDLMLRVSDNGIGIEPALIQNGRAGHFGLQGMRERAARIGARLTLVSSSTSGTTVTLLVPGHVAFRAAHTPDVISE